MTGIFHLVLTTSFYAAVVGLVILLLKGILKSKLNPEWHYLIWSILLLKLLIPFGPESAISLFNAVPEIPQRNMTEIAYEMEQQYKASLTAETPLPYVPPTQQQVRAVKTAAYGENLLPRLWILGVFLMLLWLIFTNASLHRRLHKNSLPADERMLHIFEICKTRMGIDRKITLVLQAVIGTPSLFGVVHPKILLSPAASKLSEKELEYILLHELAHYKRKDILVNYLLLVLQTVHWFNPVMWYCFKRMRQDMEVATDERVLAMLENTEHKEYGKALLAMLETFSSQKLAPRLLGMVDNKRHVERRIMMIKMASFFKGRKRITIMTGVLCMVLLGGSVLTNGMGAAGETKNHGGKTAVLSEYDADSLYKHKSRYIGDANNVSNLLEKLPFGNHKSGISLATEKSPYGITINIDLTKADVDLQRMETAFRNNAFILFALIDNVEDVSFAVAGMMTEEQNYHYSRTDAQKYFTDDLREYGKDVRTFEAFLRSLDYRISVFPEKYTPLMSSTPGIRILAEYPGSAGTVRYSAEKGAFFTWDTTTGRISKAVKTLELSYGNPAYWSPLNEEEQRREVGDSRVTVSILDPKGNILDEKQLTIHCDGSMFYTVIPSFNVVIEGPKPAETPKPKALEEAVSAAIKSQSRRYASGEVATEGHIILASEEKNKRVIVHTIASYGAFGFENDVFTKVSGSGAIPTVLTFSQNDKGEYSLVEYKEPEDGARNSESIKKMFPGKLQSKALAAHDDYPVLAKQQEAQAAEYLRSIMSMAKVSAEGVERKTPGINVQAKNKLFAEYTKNNGFLNSCPYWIGTREQVEEGVRYIYETSQSKTDDGYDLIIFTKKEKGGATVVEYKYKIVGEEPQLISLLSFPYQTFSL